MGKLQAPFPYFGGKSTIADIVWQALGDVKNYYEPFFGSGAVLLSRPDYKQCVHNETVNDKDGFVANVWRALQFNPDEVAKWCDWPVNHADLCARKKELIQHEGYLIDNLKDTTGWYDAKLAGYWIWADSCWIGKGLTRPNARPHLGNGGMGVHKLGTRPHLGNGGMGVHKLGTRPHLGNGGRGVQEPYNTNIYKWFRELAERLRYVRVVCGDWTQICGGDWQDQSGIAGYFFDPPYSTEDRDVSIYHHDSTTVAKDVLEWVRERGKRNTYRIVLAGYEEYQELLKEGWTEHKWKAGGGYSNMGKGKGKNNRYRETLYFSPHCLKRGLF